VNCRCIAGACLGLLLTLAAPAEADVRDYLGRPLADVRVEMGGMPFSDPTVLQLVETRIGDLLSMTRVRETIDHLIGLSRFEDIRVFAEPSTARPDGVVLRWELVPIQRIREVLLTGALAMDDDAIRAAIADRLGPTPPRSELDEIVRTVTALYADRGYREVAIEPHVNPTRAPELVTLTLAITAGPRTLIGDVVVAGDRGETREDIVAALRIEPGRPYDRTALAARVTDFEQGLRDKGYYEARVTVAPSFAGERSPATLTVTVDRGPLVRVVFAGDPLPAGRRDTLVPIRQERSVDLDLLEDASRNIEAYLRQEGYRSATAPYVREARDGEMVLTFTVARGPLHRLSSLEVSGNQAIPLAELQPLLALEAGEPFVDGRVATVANAVTEAYRVRGFARVAVKPEITLGNSASDGGGEYRPVAVRLVVAEGGRTTVSAVTIAGARVVSEATVRSLLALQPARPYYRPQLDADRDAIERHYRNQGFQAVRVEAQTTPSADGAELHVHWEIREGGQTVIDRVLVSGNARTDAELIRREVGLLPGQPLGEEVLIEGQRRLAALGLFRRVRIAELPHGSATSRDILIEVEESPATTVAYGGGVEAGQRARTGDEGQAVDRVEVAPRAFFEITRRNLWGKNRSISLFTRISLRASDPAIDSTDPTEGGYGFNEYRVLGTFREPRPFNRTGDLQFSVFLEQAIRSSFNFARRGGQLEYSRRLDERVTVSGRYSLDTTRLFDQKIALEDQVNVDRFFPQARLSMFTGSVLRDSRDDVLDPARGTVLGIDAGLAARALGSEIGFVKGFGQAFWYRRLPRASKLTLVAGARVGLAEGFERLATQEDENGQPVLDESGRPVRAIVDDVPARERFFAGGDTTVRGFVLDRLGTCANPPVCDPETDTLSDRGFPTGGNGLVVLNVELRTAYWKGLSGVGFVDVGNVFRRVNQIDLSELRPAVGFGVRFRSPIGPVRGDLGFNVNPRTLPSPELASSVRERGVVFHISLGQAF
jgi:outer membrane protein insertion porin family